MTSQSAMTAERDRELIPIALVILVQLVAVAYFLWDAVREEGGLPALLDLFVGLALFAGIALGALVIRRLLGEARKREEVVAIARGALGDLMRKRFSDWNLSRGEAEVALFALKGCSIAEIAALRGSSPGTVRSQLSQVYTKSGVTGQPMLMSLFLDDLLDATPMAPN
ncbi:helix-turn-helix transcriptional regulator [Qipengyuania sp.]|uniref:helix-turn-helix transcriptional regulator n=1 Tax=Qipengyuania sp. TaxID=2004515 RepID=UPI003AF410D1